MKHSVYMFAHVCICVSSPVVRIVCVGSYFHQAIHSFISFIFVSRIYHSFLILLLRRLFTVASPLLLSIDTRSTLHELLRTQPLSRDFRLSPSARKLLQGGERSPSARGDITSKRTGLAAPRNSKSRRWRYPEIWSHQPRASRCFSPCT